MYASMCPQQPLGSLNRQKAPNTRDADRHVFPPAKNENFTTRIVADFWGLIETGPSNCFQTLCGKDHRSTLDP